jgi:hypothetical protein
VSALGSLALASVRHLPAIYRENVALTGEDVTAVPRESGFITAFLMRMDGLFTLRYGWLA